MTTLLLEKTTWRSLCKSSQGTADNIPERNVSLCNEIPYYGKLTLREINVNVQKLTSI